MIPENQKLIRLRDKSNGGEMTCIVCPIGCRLQVEVNDAQGGERSILISGNQCKRGEAYALEEFSDPRRVVTATCAINSQYTKRLSVKSSDAVPVENIEKFLNIIYEQRIEVPIHCGDVLVQDVAGSGINLLATQTIET